MGGGPGHDETAQRGVGGPVDVAALLGEFLRSRRERLRPQDVGLPAAERHRRVPGLRREEVAQLAGVSVAYLTRLEQGRAPNVSSGVLDALARALRLSAAERAHVDHLARRNGHAEPVGLGVGLGEQRVRPELERLLRSIEGVPAYVAGRRCDLLAWNRAAAVVFGDWAQLAPARRNWARLVFLDSALRGTLVDWEAAAADAVGDLRLYAGRHRDDPDLAALVDELSAASDTFRRLWASHDVADVNNGMLALRHPVLGELTLAFESLPLPGDDEQCLTIYHCEPGSALDTRLRDLAGSAGPEAGAFDPDLALAAGCGAVTEKTSSDSGATFSAAAYPSGSTP